MTLSKRQAAAVRTGQVVLAGDHYKVRVSFIDGSRPWIHLPPGLSEDQARERAARIAKKAIEERWTRKDEAAATEDAREARTGTDTTTIAGWFETNLEDRERRGQAASAPASHVKTWIIPALGENKRMDAVTPDDLRQLVAALDRAVAHDEIRWKTATNIWGTVTKAFKDATNSKNDKLRVLTTNPARDIPPPDKGRLTAKVHIFPSEFIKLMNCPVVPLVRRRAYAFAIYLYLRPAELEALDWIDFDLAHEQVTIQRSISRELGTEKAPKNGMARLPMSIEPELMPLLVAMKRESGGKGRLFGRLASESDLAGLLRADLLLAAVSRHELHHNSKDPPREWMTMHDLRTTGITWMAVRGDPLLVVKARAGHSSTEMTEHYINIAAVLRKSRYGEPFPALPASLLGATEHEDTETDDAESASRVLH